MRILVACLALLVAPTLTLVAIKHYQALHIEEQEPEGTVADGKGQVLFFNASWCGPCRQMKPIVTQMRHQGYRIRDIDVDQNRTLSQKYGIRSIPTFVFLKNGKEVHRFSGGTSRENLRALCSNSAYH